VANKLVKKGKKLHLFYFVAINFMLLTSSSMPLIYAQNV